MENPTPADNAMNDFDPDEKERLENWRALQISLGLVPDELPIPAAEMTAPPAPPSPPRAPEPPPSPPKSVDDVIIESVAAEMLAPTAEVQDDTLPPAAGEDQEVEVGEAPEEVPEEPGEEAPAPGDKKRRRRRRRRRRGAGEGPAEGAPQAEANGEPGAAEMPSAEAEAAGEDDEEFEGEDDEEEIEPISIPDWNVPTWQELIDGLYRPER